MCQNSLFSYIFLKYFLKIDICKLIFYTNIPLKYITILLTITICLDYFVSTIRTRLLTRNPWKYIFKGVIIDVIMCVIHKKNYQVEKEVVILVFDC